jgi:threonine synthase
MGLYVDRFIAATNRNDVIPEYLKSGSFKSRQSVETISNAMDVGNPSNFERMKALYKDHTSMQKDIFGASFDDTQTRNGIGELYRDTNYVMDPHGAVAFLGLQQYQQNVEARPGIFLETAHPAKFPDVVEAEIGRKLEVPSTLASCLSLKENWTPMKAEFSEFRSFLMGK